MARPRKLSMSKLPAGGDREAWFRYYAKRSSKGIAGAESMAVFYLRKGLENNEAWALNEPIGGK